MGQSPGGRSIGMAGLGLVGVLSLWGALSVAAAPAAPRATAAAGAAFPVQAPPRVAAAMAEMARRPILRPATAPNQTEPVRVEYQTFEAADFPPPGWAVVDNKAAGVGQSPRWTWDREECDVDPLRGGLRSVWAVGGGSAGSLVACGSTYTDPVDSWLIFGAFDATDFAGGLQANMLLRFNQANPAGGNFQLCATSGPAVTDTRCRPINPGNTNWTTFGDLPQFPWSAGLPQVVFALRYVDETAPGNVFGAFADNVLIEGLPESGAETPTATTQATTPAAATPTPTMQRPTNTPRPTERGPVLLPFVARGVAREELQRPASSGVSVAFAVDVDGDGNLIQPGSVFQYGIPSICAKISWFGMAPGADLSWKWFRNGAPLNIAGLDGSRSDVTPSGWIPSCAQGGEDENGSPIPVPKGNFDVAVYLNGSAAATTTERVVIQDDPPPGATAIPTGPLPTRAPTQAPTPGPTETPEPGASGCSNYLLNGDFEAGPTRWYAFLNQQQVNPSLIIMKAADANLVPPPPSVDGEWLAQLGARLNVEEQLGQRWDGNGALVQPSQMISATLQFSFMAVTEETANGTPDDWLAPFFVRQDGTGEQAPNSGISEELVGSSIQAGAWYRLSSDVTQLMTRRPNWDESALVFVSRHNDRDLTVFLVDKVVLTVCQSPAGPLQARRGALPWGSASGDGDLPALRPERAGDRAGSTNHGAWTPLRAPVGFQPLTDAGVLMYDGGPSRRRR